MNLKELFNKSTPLPWNFSNKFLSKGAGFSPAQEVAISKIYHNRLLSEHTVNMLPKIIAVLEFYADKDNWKGQEIAAETDGGTLARNVLKELNEVIEID